jgi:hypothetical protein
VETRLPIQSLLDLDGDWIETLLDVVNKRKAKRR